jgi:ferrochelatase
VGDHLSALADAGTKAVIVCPIGFVADHIEVVWDLDNELRLQADELGVALARAATPNADRRFARLAIDLIDELREGSDPSRAESPPGVEAPPLYGLSVDGALCTPECGKS